MFGNLIYQH